MEGHELDGLAGRRVLVVGDAILDRYLHGSVDRISPEAPVPVVRLHGDEARLGGAANVVANLVALGLNPILVAARGDDEPGRTLVRLLESRGVDPGYLVGVPGRPTTVKTRVLARHQQVVRLDFEDDRGLPGEDSRRLVERALLALDEVEGLVLSDYAKGVLDERSLPEILQAARRRHLPVVIDPKIRHFPFYTPATVITPNQSEAARATAREIHDESGALAAALDILARLDVEAVLVTRGEEGMLLVSRNGEPESIRARAREVYDVTGAGDTVAATLGAALAAGLSLARAAHWANAAAAVAVGRLGTAAVTLDELRAFSGD